MKDDYKTTVDVKLPEDTEFHVRAGATPALDYRVARLLEEFPIPPGTNGVLLRERGAIWVKMVAYNKSRPDYVKVKFWMAVKKCWSGGQKEVPTSAVKGMSIGA